jgi:membrane protein implicated in regulation of membrane protease activity
VARPPTRGQWLLMSFLASGWFVLVLGASAVFFGVLAAATGDTLFVVFTVFGVVVFGLNLFMRSRSTFDVRTSTRTLAAGDVSARGSVLAAIQPMEPDQEPETDADGSISIDCWRVGATLGVHLTVALAPADGGTRVDATSRLHLRQPPARRSVTEAVLREFDEALAHAAKGRRATT